MIWRAGSLGSKHPRRWDIPLLWMGCAVLLGFGLLRPGFELTGMGGLSKTTYSVIAGIRDLLKTGHPVLALIIFTFSLVFPIIKLVSLALVWVFRFNTETRHHWMDRLKVLGKWSMLDVFVVAAMMGLVRFGWLADASALPGIFLYAASIVLTIILIHLVANLAGASFEPVVPRGLPVLTGIPVEAPALILLGLGYELPLMHVEKWVLWKNDYSILSGTLALWREGSHAMAIFMGVFVVLAPTVRLLSYLALRFLRPSGDAHRRLSGFARMLNRWTMAEVFVLGLLVVSAKLGGVVGLQPAGGLWCLLAGTGISMLLSWPVHSSRRR